MVVLLHHQHPIKPIVGKLLVMSVSKGFSYEFLQLSLQLYHYYLNIPGQTDRRSLSHIKVEF